MGLREGHSVIRPFVEALLGPASENTKEVVITSLEMHAEMTSVGQLVLSEIFKK